MLLKIALNGARPKAESEYLPHSLNEIEREVTLLYKNGCKVFHIHSYGSNGRESLRPGDVDNLVLRVKNISADIMFGISSGDWIEPDLEKRISYIKNWKYVPDFASVNMIEESALVISDILISRGVMIEAGLNEEKATEIFAKSNIRNNCCRILIEPEEENLAAAAKTISEIEKILDSNKIMIPRLLHGFNSVSWNLLREAKNRGYDGRIGMEDTLYLENGKKVTGNLELFNEAKRILNSD